MKRIIAIIIGLFFFYYWNNSFAQGIVHHRDASDYNTRRFARHAQGRAWRIRHMTWAQEHQTYNAGRWHEYYWKDELWGPGISVCPWYWNIGVGKELGLNKLAYKKNWNEIYKRLNTTIDELHNEHAMLLAQRPVNYQHADTIDDQIDLLESYIADAKVYEITPITMNDEATYKESYYE